MDDRGLAPTGLALAGLVGTLAGAALVAAVLTGTASRPDMVGPVTVDPAAVTNAPTVPGATDRPSDAGPPTQATTRSARPAPTGGPVAPRPPVASEDDDDDDDDGSDEDDDEDDGPGGDGPGDEDEGDDD